MATLIDLSILICSLFLIEVNAINYACLLVDILSIQLVLARKSGYFNISAVCGPVKLSHLGMVRVRQLSTGLAGGWNARLLEPG